MTHSEQIVFSSRYCAYFMFVRSRKNLHTCKLPLAGSRSPIIKYARGSHIGFAFLLYKPDTFVRASNAQVSGVHYLHTPPWFWNHTTYSGEQVSLVCYFVWAERSRQRFRPRTCLRAHVDHGRWVAFRCCGILPR